MTTKNENSNISIAEAVETLSTIAELDSIAESIQDNQIKQNQSLSYKTVYWLKHHEKNKTVGIVKEVFKVILTYFQKNYNNEYLSSHNEHIMEGIKTIMVLVGEAAKKLDKFNSSESYVDAQNIQNSSVTEFAEYKNLQEFYIAHTSHKIDEATLGKWILGLAKRNWDEKNDTPEQSERKNFQAKHVFIDLESVKKDTEYDLFFLRKEDGTRFFSPRLIRNIKLVNDFGDSFGDKKGDDPLTSLDLWKDRILHASSGHILSAIQNLLDPFFQETKKNKNNELVIALKKVIMALYLAHQPHNLLRNNPIKSCTDYFIDFQKFLNDAINTRYYQKLIAYPPEASSVLPCLLLNITHHLCYYFVTGSKGYQEIIPDIQTFISEALLAQSEEHNEVAKSSNLLCDRLIVQYRAMNKYLKRHPNGPLGKILEILEEGDYQKFDPLAQNNLPNHLYAINHYNRKIDNIRLPCPTCQEFINQAEIKDEFKGFLRALIKHNNNEKHLMINLQDRTSWREHFRCKTLEDFQNCNEFSNHFVVVTIPTDTEFYHQEAPYNLDNQVNHFFENFKKNLLEDSFGFFFPAAIKEILQKDFFDQMLHGIHQIFFSGKNVLTKDQRKNFIEIFYMFLNIKLIELINPKIFSFSCKDCIDDGGSKNVLLYAGLKFIQGEKFSEEELQQLDLMIYGPSILIRERNMLPMKFNRMLGALKTIEVTQSEMGINNFSKKIEMCIGNCFLNSLFEYKIAIPER